MNQEVQAPPQKKSKVLVWILGGCGVLVVLVLIIVLALGFFVRRKLKAAGDNPAMVAAEIMVRANPELELVSSDYTKGTLTVRNKKTGDVLTFDASEAQKGNFRFTNEKGEEVNVSGSDGKMHIQTEKGEATFGAGASTELPAWAPTYPGATSEGVMDSTSDKGRQVSLILKTGDSVKQVVDFYEANLKSGGFKVSTIRTGEGGMVTGEDKAAHRNIHVMVGKEGAQTSATLTCVEGKE